LKQKGTAAAGFSCNLLMFFSGKRANREESTAGEAGAGAGNDAAAGDNQRPSKVGCCDVL
jgi:hypothetical protein